MSKNTKRSQKRGPGLTSYSFTEPVVRVLSDKAKEKPGLHRETKPSKNIGTKARLVIFHKRKGKCNDADISGIKNLSAWKNTSGHGKPWKTCRRLRITRDDLDLLTSANGHPISFGWRFSTTNTPITFVKSQGLNINKQSNLRRTKVSSGFQTIKDLDKELAERLDEEYSPYWPLPGEIPRRHWNMRRGIQFRAAPEELPKRFLRINMTYETVDMTAEEYPREILLSPCQSLPLHKEERQKGLLLKHLVVLDLVRNENHADVYLVKDSNNYSKTYHAHAFLSEGLLGNGGTFMRRKMDRLRKSHDFLAETVQLGRNIIVMKIDSKADNTFHVKNTQREFPSLPGTVVQCCKSGRKQYRRSYAAIVAKKPTSKKGTTSNHRAYKAWQERKGIQKAQKKNMTTTPNIMNPLETKLETFSARTYPKKLPNIPLVNRFATLLLDSGSARDSC